MTTIQQWITAFNILVTIYLEKAAGDAPKLMKYCEEVRHLSNKSADWLFYDEQFCYLKQSAPHRYPWDQIHWELWLRAMSNFCGKTPLSTGADKANAESVFDLLPANFPKGHAGHFTPVSNAGDASMSMSALNAMQNIRQVNVRSQQPTSAPMLENPDHNIIYRFRPA